jgi:hypothetical protein
MYILESGGQFIFLFIFISFFAIIDWKSFAPVPVSGHLQIPFSHKANVSCGSLFFPVYLSILTLIKNEGMYLEEWIEYHVLVGVEKFHLVMNDNEDNSSEILVPYLLSGLVKLSSWPGKRQQKRIYDHYVRRLRRETCWVAIIDVDEFLVPLDTHWVPEILRRFEHVPGVTANWVVFGSNGQQQRSPGLVIERFRNHTSLNITRNRHTKTIVNPRLVTHCVIHEHFYVTRVPTQGPTGRPNLEGMFNREPIHRVLRINHYWIKSAEEFAEKRARGRAGVYFPGITKQLLHAMGDDIASTRDDVPNDSAVDWAIPLIKANFANRRSFGPIVRNT